MTTHTANPQIGPSGATDAPPPRVVNFGCRLNALESEIIEANATAAHATGTVVINTCAVTAEAVRQARQTIRKLAKEQPEARIVVTGCAAQINPDQFAAMPEVAHVLGNEHKLAPDAVSPATLAKGRVQTTDIMTANTVARHKPIAPRHHTRAFVQIQNGCDHRCTFCIIPYGRGNSRSVPQATITDEIKALVDQGVAEIVLTGVDLTSYGADLDSTPSLGTPSLGTLVANILSSVPGLPRLRLSSIDSIEVDDALFDIIVSEPRVMPHLHLSLQSGDPMILKRMKRRHSPDDAVEFCTAVRNKRPEVTLGADFIVGFPTETGAMFENTVNHVNDCGLTWLHVFPFSPRDGTPAARMPQLDKHTIKHRAQMLRDHGADLWHTHAQSRLGTTATVLVEAHQKGLAEDFSPVHLAQECPRGTIVPVRITHFSDNKLVGAPIT